jgi:hypothetical protein
MTVIAPQWLMGMGEAPRPGGWVGVSRSASRESEGRVAPDPDPVRPASQVVHAPRLQAAGDRVRRVLVVDDNRDGAAMIAHLLARGGHEVLACSGDGAGPDAS